MANWKELEHARAYGWFRITCSHVFKCSWMDVIRRQRNMSVEKSLPFSSRALMLCLSMVSAVFEMGACNFVLFLYRTSLLRLSSVN